MLRETVARRALCASLTLGVVGYATGHASMAFAAGALADAIAHPSQLSSFPALGRWGGSIAALTYVGLVSAVVKAGAGVILAGSERRLGADVAGRLRVELIGTLLRRGVSLPAPRALATLAVRLREVEAAVTLGVVTSVRATLQLLPLAACLVAISPKLSGFAAVALLPFGAAIAALRGRARRASDTAQRQVETLELGVDELVRNADLFRTYGAGERVLAAVQRAGAAAGASAARVEMTRSALSGGNEVMGALAILGAVSVAQRLDLTAHSGELLPFAAVFFLAYRPLRDLGDARAWTGRGTVALDALRLAIGGPGSATEGVTHGGDGVADDRAMMTPGADRGVARHAPAGPEEPPRPPPELDLLALGAVARGPVTTCHVGSGEIACLLGPTGSGKTTLFRVLLGLDAARGQLLVDGCELTRAATGPGHRPFAWVPQEAPLVTGTVTDNVMLFGGTPSAAAEALADIGAGRLAELAWEEQVGPGGRPLSGGERRQVSLARALVTGLPVLLLDEPTEGLDAASTRAVLDAICRLRGRRTVLVATHREDVVALADRIIHVGSAPVASGAPEASGASEAAE